MTGNLAVLVLAVLVLWSFTVLATRVGQEYWIIVRLIEPTTVAAVNGHLVLSIAELTIRTGPVEKG